MCVCLEEKGREGEKTECLDQSVVSVNGHKRGISSKTDIQKLRTILGYHRCRMLTLEKKIKSNNGQCAYSLIDRYQQHGGEESVERKTQLSVTDQTCKTLFADFTAQEPHLH